ncbi:hypothetical protein SAMN05216266_10865 [Amycolatopsis marina]|uniref:Excreted virulence factor EspC, type VII ESX diderm n=1 Tax=Amycolatopsis marina TaxID=490629 RepID=A0A1I1A0Q6_9PSEU|nr:hypothetical protein [Amycolatopsis marina]SFB31397.1 hypothetical protein SAMN05216266_10865 [Amycolatopsis marina]
MATFRIDAAAVGEYVSGIRRAADDLESAARVPRAGELTADAFGAVGRELGVHDAYFRAAEVLRSQLRAGGQALGSSSDALDEVVRKHSDGDDERAEDIRRAGRL